MSNADEIRRRMFAAADEALAAAAQHLMGEAQRRAPVDEGTLRASAHTERTEHGDGVDYEVSFNTPYAAAQHEGHATMNRNGTTYEWVVRQHPKGGESKYLERPLLENSGRYERLVAENVRRSLEGP